jgi:hypothetical protein
MHDGFGQAGLSTGNNNASGSLGLDSCDAGRFFERIWIKQQARVRECLKQLRLTDASSPLNSGLFGSTIDSTKRFAVVFTVPAINLHAAEDFELCGIHPSSNFWK